MKKFIAHAENTTYTFATNDHLDAETEYTVLKRIILLHPEVRYIEVLDDFGVVYTHYNKKATKNRR